jgi:hypothetical protein
MPLFTSDETLHDAGLTASDALVELSHDVPQVKYFLDLEPLTEIVRGLLSDGFDSLRRVTTRGDMLLPARQHGRNAS